MDRLDLLEKHANENTNLTVKIQKIFELPTAQFIHKPLEQVPKWSVFQNKPSYNL